MKTEPWTFLVTGLFLVSLLTGAASAANPPAIEWQNVLGGSADDIALSIRQTTDGGYILVGITVSGSSGSYTSANQDVLVMKLDKEGYLLWQKVYGGYSDDGGLSIEETTDGGYVLAGYTTVNRYSQGYVSSTTSPTYSTGYNAVTYPAYNYPYDGSTYTIYAVSGQGTGTSTKYTPSTGVSSDRDVLVIKLDPAGNLLWQKVLGGNAEDTGSGIQQTKDGGYILVGSTASSNSRDVGLNHGRFDVWVVKLDTGGNLLWQKVLGGYMEDTGSGIQQTDDGGYILVGTTASENSGDVGMNHGSQDVWVVKLDTGGNLQWQKVLGGGDSDVGSSIRQTASGEFILTGFTVSSSTGDVGLNNGRYEVWVVKLDSAGDLLWQKVLGGSAYDYGTSIWPAADGGYVLTGYTSSSNSGDVGANHGLNDIWAVKLNSAGDLLWQKLLGGYASDRGYGIQQTNDGGYVLTGCTESSNSGDVGTNYGANDVWVVKMFPNVSAFPSTPIPSVGQAAGTYQVGFDGLSFNADGRNTLDLDLQKARRSMATVAVYADRVELYQQAPDRVLVTFRGTNFAVKGDKITGPVTTADFVTDPVTAPLIPGMVSGSVRANLPSLTQPGMLKATIGDHPDSSLVDQFRAVMEQNNLEYDSVAYTYDVRKSNMPPTGNAIVVLTLPEQWVNQHGGIGAIRIIRVSDTTGVAELIPAIYHGTDTKGMVQFKGTSVNGTSIFGLVTLKASKIAQERDTDLNIFPLQQPAISTFLGLITWLLGSVQQNPAGAIAIVATASAAYAGRQRGMW